MSFTNRYETTEAEVEKTWADEFDGSGENRDGKRPESVTMRLYANNMDTGIRVTLSADAEKQKSTPGTKELFSTATFDLSRAWDAKVKNLPKYEKFGSEITYTFLEDPVDNYTISGYETVGTKTTIENTYTPGRFCLTILKVWDDGNDQDGLRKEFTVRLMAGSDRAVKWNAERKAYEPVPDLVLNQDNNWTAMVLGVPVNAGGKPIEYKWYELDVPEGYTSSATHKKPVSMDECRVNSITNTHTPAVTQITVKKNWDDADNQDGLRPETVTVELLKQTGTADPVPAAETMLSEDENWSHTFENLPVMEAGQTITYSVREINVPAGYAAATAESEEEGIDYEITNTLVPDTTMVKVVKIWNDANDQDGLRKNVNAVVKLYRTVNGEETEIPDSGRQVGTEDGWYAEWTGLPVKEAGNTITYSVRETMAEGQEKLYTAAVGDPVEAKKDDSGTITVTNTHATDLTYSTVAKVWNNNGHDARQPESIIAILKADDTAVTARTLKQENNWTATMTGLPKNKNGQPIVYTWEEAAVPAGYASKTSVDENGTWIITNTYLTGSLIIRKKIEGGGTNDFSGLIFRVIGPGGFDITVPYSEFKEDQEGRYWATKDLQTGDYVVYETNAGDPAVISTQLTLLHDSVTAMKARVTEAQTEIPAVTLVNKYETETTSVMVMKMWDDMDNLDGSRPASIDMTLSNGRQVTLNAGNNWIAEITDLPLYDANGNVISYTWTEADVTGYVQQSVTTLGNATVFLNKHEPDLTSTTVTKVWDDGNNAAGLRPATLKVTLSNGRSYTLSEANKWTVKVDNLPKFYQGQEIHYTWSEQTVLGYSKEVKEVGDVTIFINHYDITPPPPPTSGGPGTPGKRGTPLYVFGDYGTPLGVEVEINHVGDCFE